MMDETQDDGIRISIYPGVDRTLSPSLTESFTTKAKHVAGSGSKQERAKRLWQWAMEQYEYTPNRHPTIDSFLADTGGNCMDHAVLLLALFQVCGLEARLMREINLQPESEEREASAHSVSETVFGRRHNDHTWTEVQTENGWVPTDSALHLFGTESWVKARVETGCIPIYGMVVPLLVVAYDGGGQGVGVPVNRTEYYLLEETGRLLPSWRQKSDWHHWESEIEFFSTNAISVFDMSQSFDLSKASEHLIRMGNIITALRQ